MTKDGVFMPEKLKELLEKINEEGVRQAEENAGLIESKAKSDAEKIVEDAKNKAERIIDEANASARKMQETSEIALRQASRDLILSLKDDIRKVLNKIISFETAKAMSREDISAVLGRLIEKYVDKDGESSDIRVLLKKDDLDALKGTFISKLKQDVKDGVEFRPSANINAGFTISFDKGRSYFDFTDEGVAEALSCYLNPELAKLLK